MLRNLVFNNIAVYSDRFILDRDEILLLSICGPTSAVVAVASGLLSYGNVCVQTSGHPLPKLEGRVDIDDSYEYGSRGGNTYTAKTRSLSWGRAHCLISDTELNLKNNYDKDFVVIGSDAADVKERVFDVLNSRPIPLLEDWKKWLLSKLLSNGDMQFLKAFGCSAAKVRYQENDILELLSSGIKAGELDIPVAETETELLRVAA